MTSMTDSNQGSFHISIVVSQYVMSTRPPPHFVQPPSNGQPHVDRIPEILKADTWPAISRAECRPSGVRTCFRAHAVSSLSASAVVVARRPAAHKSRSDRR